MELASCVSLGDPGSPVGQLACLGERQSSTGQVAELLRKL